MTINKYRILVTKVYKEIHELFGLGLRLSFELLVWSEAPAMSRKPRPHRRYALRDVETLMVPGNT